jgi:cellulose synthase/poly-beta-1,6-N-acetylglucosamine synthase-like glycosyltransferase
MQRRKQIPKPAAASVNESGIDISVIVAFYNAEKHIEECIKALLSQDYPSSRYEVIMVDNNSTDSSPALVKKYPRIKLISESKQGAYASRNRGVAASKGNILAFTDADCMPASDWLREISRPLHSSTAGLAQGARSYAGESPALAMLAAYECERIDFTFSGTNAGMYFGYTNNMAVRRDIFDRAGPFIEVGRGADTLFVLQVIAQYSCDVICYAPNARILHLEITNVRKWFQKRFFTAGVSNKTGSGERQHSNA